MDGSNQISEVAIIGGGPAGMSAALWCAELGLDAVLFERSNELGGQLHKIHNPIKNYLGLSAANGREILSHFRDSIAETPFERKASSNVVGIDPSSMSIRLDTGFTMTVRVLILATGVRRRRLMIPGEQEFQARGILESGVRDRHLVKGKRVLIVGGGDAAIENSILLAEDAAHVTVAFRRSEPTARVEFVKEALARNNVTFLCEKRLTEIQGGSVVESAILESTSNGTRSNEPIDAVLIRIGVEPNSELIAGEAELDDRGYVLVNSNCESSLPGVYAIGDVANPISLTISQAVGSGATAAKSALEFIRNVRPGTFAE